MHPRQSIHHPYLVFCIAFLFLSMLASCSIKKILPPEGDKTRDDISTAYRKIILNSFETQEGLSKSSPDIAAVCENAALQELLNISSAPMIVRAPSRSIKEEDTLIVRVRLAMTHVTLKTHSKTPLHKTKLTAWVRLIDASTGKTLSEENIFTADHTIIPDTDHPKHLGIAVARHIDKFIRK
jgi:hypothetical protein